MLAIVYDIHGNSDALEAVIQDARLQGAYQWMLGGDYALMGPEPAEVFDRLKRLRRSSWMRGNTERWIDNPASDDIPEGGEVDSAISFTREALGFDRLQELKVLPETLFEDGILFCHASPASDMKGFMPLPQVGEERMLRGNPYSMVVAGHTHMQFHRRIGMTDVINPGSVGMPFDGDSRAAYALRHDNGLIEFRRVEYDTQATLRKLEAFHAPWADLARKRIETAAP